MLREKTKKVIVSGFFGLLVVVLVVMGFELQEATDTAGEVVRPVEEIIFEIDEEGKVREAIISE